MNMRDQLLSDIEDQEVHDKVKQFIDDVESKVNSIRDKMEIKSLSDLWNLEDAKSEIDDLSKELY